MKLRNHEIIIFVLNIVSVNMMISKPQPVVATKDKGVETKEWTIGIYDAKSTLIPGSENVVFKRDTKFLSGKGKKLFFYFDKGYNYIYVYKGKTDKKTNLATANLEPTPLKSEAITQNDAPPEHSKINITKDDKVVVVEIAPKMESIPVRIERPLYNKIDKTITIAKTEKVSSKDDIYSESSVRPDYSMVSVPLNRDFYIILSPSLPGIKTKVQKNSVGLLITQDKEGDDIEIKKYTTKEFSNPPRDMMSHFAQLQEKYSKVNETKQVTITSYDPAKQYTITVYNLEKTPKEEVSQKDLRLVAAYKDLFYIPVHAAFSILVKETPGGCTKETSFVHDSTSNRTRKWRIHADCSIEEHYR